MNRLITISLLGTLLFYSSCLITPEDPEKDLWFPLLETEAITPIRNIHATSDEFYAISDDEFFRFNQDNELIERRPLLLPLRFFGRPSLSDNAIVRVTRQNNNNQVIEFHSARANNPSLDVEIDQFSNPGEELISDANARYTGAFNSTGDQYLLPCLSLPNNFFTCLLIDIQYNTNRTKIESVNLNKRIDIPDLPADFKTLQNVRFINGQYYLASLDGAFRVSPTGTVERIFRDWKFDFFSYEGNLYATGASGQLFESDNNGQSWERFGNRATELDYVEAQNSRIFTHPFVGAMFQLGDVDLLQTSDIRYNLDFPDDLAAYNNIRFFQDKYYLTVQKQLYYTEDLQTRD